MRVAIRSMAPCSVDAPIDISSFYRHFGRNGRVWPPAGLAQGLNPRPGGRLVVTESQVQGSEPSKERQDVPVTPPTEPPPAPVQDPPAEPDPTPYVVWAGRWDQTGVNDHD